MILSQISFTEKLMKGQLKVAFVGMSNIGKTYWAQTLEKDLGFYRVSVDDQVAEDLSLSDEAQMAQWLGHPHELKYQRNHHHYLDRERHWTVKDHGVDKNFVLDTTGSVVHLDGAALDKLKQEYLVIHIEAEPSMLDYLSEKYFREPKPVVWGKCFQKSPAEDAKTALQRSYPRLLHHRLNKYRSVADLSVSARELRQESRSSKDFWEMVVRKLPPQ